MSCHRWSTFLQLMFLCLFVSSLGSRSAAQPTNSSSRLIKVATQPGGDLLQFLDDSHAWLYTFSDLWQTHDGGLTWQRIRFPQPRGTDPAGIPPSLITAHLESPLSGWIRVENSKYGPDVLTTYRTDDGGQTWPMLPSSPLVATGIPTSQFYRPGGLTGWEGGKDLITVTEPALQNKGPCVPWYDGRMVRPAIVRTVDGGRHWMQQTLPQSMGCEVQMIAFQSADVGVAVAQHGVYYTRDGGTTWRLGKFLACCADSDWNDVTSLPPTTIVLLNSTVGWLTYADGYVFRTTDAGKTWRQLTHPGQIWHEQFGLGNSGEACFISEKLGWIRGGDRALYETKDGGTKWSKVKSPGFISSVSCASGHGWALSEDALYRIETK
jgi:photosystem II stability/assembly factor-like uncharacterized protein